VVEDDVSVILGRRGVFHPEIAGSHLSVGQGGVFGDGRRVAPGAADGENSGGRAVVAFFFGDRSGGDRVAAFAPDETVFSEAALPRCADGFPVSARFLIEAEGDVRAVPAVGGADEALGGVRRELEGGGGEKGAEDEEEGFHGKIWKIWKMKREQDAPDTVWSGDAPATAGTLQPLGPSVKVWCGRSGWRGRRR
jgi:hypothetical protein